MATPSSVRLDVKTQVEVHLTLNVYDPTTRKTTQYISGVFASPKSFNIPIPNQKTTLEAIVVTPEEKKGNILNFSHLKNAVGIEVKEKGSPVCFDESSSTGSYAKGELISFS